MPAFAHFEIDIVSALADQLLGAFDALTPAALSEGELGELPVGQGVYQLRHQGTLVYVGKADSLKSRLGQHRRKIAGRQNISLTDMSFECLYVHPNWTTLAPETSLIAHYKSQAADQCEWNGNGFGPHDPGRERETTNKPPEGFDALYPIRDDWRCDWIRPGTHNGNELLRSLKSGLPYLLRYETARRSLAQGHPDYNGVGIDVPTPDMPARDLLSLIASHLPGWQATLLPSHLILYKEHRDYAHGTVLARG